MSKVFVLDANEIPLNPMHPGRAKLFLSSGKAAVYRRYPFTIILKTFIDTPKCSPFRIKIDPGAKTTGLAIVNDTSGEVVFAAELEHRGFTIAKSLISRSAIRRNRRNRKTRYRAPRFSNRLRREGWLAPSLQSRIANVATWVRRLMRVCPITSISIEDVKFDTQLMENAEITGIEYQQGTLNGYERRQYVLEKWNYTCAYCDKKNCPLEEDHIVPRSKGGSDRVSNRCAACVPCNRSKGNKNIKDFLKNDPDRLKRILAHAKAPLKDAAAMNAIRKKLLQRLEEFGLPIECGSGGRTKYNRTIRRLSKTHWIDAACVGASTPEVLQGIDRVQPLLIKAMGSGHRHVQGIDGYGFPRKVGKDDRAEDTNGRLSGKERHEDPELMHQMNVGGKLVPRPIRRIGEDMRKTIAPRKHKYIHKFQTGDMVRVTFPQESRGKHRGQSYISRIKAAKSDGQFTMYYKGKVISFSHKYCKAIHRHDGYSYS